MKLLYRSCHRIVGPTYPFHCSQSLYRLETSLMELSSTRECAMQLTVQRPSLVKSNVFAKHAPQTQYPAQHQAVALTRMTTSA
jgi:hypothetical protein